MSEKDTNELEKVLGKTHPSDISAYMEANKEVLIPETGVFGKYIKEIIKEKDITQQQVFLDADIPERYGYKLLSEEKHTRQRDIILRICYAAKLSVEETQTALKLYRMPCLYAKNIRDALLMTCLSNRPGTIIDVNTYLKANGLTPLKTSGTQD